jgi:hypothetical protein
MLSGVSAVPSRRGGFCSRVTVRYLNDWSPETYRAARKGSWLQLAADRLKFESKICVFECQ